MQRWETLCNLFTCSTSSNIKRLNQIKRLKPFYKRIRSFEINLNLNHSNPWDLRCIKQALYYLEDILVFFLFFEQYFFRNLFSVNLISSSEERLISGIENKVIIAILRKILKILPFKYAILI
jgi:hypothetical protein